MRLDLIFEKRWSGFYSVDIDELIRLTSVDFAYEIDKLLAEQGNSIKIIEIYEDNRRIIIDIFTEFDFTKAVYHMDNARFYTNDTMYYSEMEQALQRAKELELHG